MKTLININLVALLCLTATVLNASNIADVLRLPSESALGGSGVASAGATYINPANLTARNKETQIIAFKTLFGWGLTADVFALSHSGKWGIAAISFMGVGYETQIAKDDAGNISGEVANSDSIFDVRYGKTVYEDIQCGIGLKYLNSRMAGYSDSGVAFDMGVRKRMNDLLSIGLAWNNVSLKKTRFINEDNEFPSKIVAGANLSLFRTDALRLNFVADAATPFMGKNYVSGGFEVDMGGSLFLRGGMSGEKPGAFSAGIEIFAGDFALDYAYLGNFMTGHSVGLKYRFQVFGGG